MIETFDDREALAAAWGDSLRVGSVTVPGIFDLPQAEDLLVEGVAPSFLALASALESASITRSSTIDEVTTHYGRTFGPYRVVRWQSQDDGAFVLLGLEAL